MSGLKFKIVLSSAFHIRSIASTTSQAFSPSFRCRKWLTMLNSNIRLLTVPSTVTAHRKFIGEKPYDESLSFSNVVSRCSIYPSTTYLAYSVLINAFRLEEEYLKISARLFAGFNSRVMFFLLSMLKIIRY